MELPGALGLFSLSAVIVMGAAISLAVAADVIAARTGWGRLWVGSLLVAGATSLPELATNIAAVRIGAPALAGGNILGANMLNMSNLALVASLMGGRHIFQRLAPQQVTVAAVALALTALATLLVVLQPEAKWLGISPATIAILGVYLVGSRILYRRSAGITEPDAPEASHSLRWGWIVFALSAGAIFAAAPMLATSAQRIAQLTGVAESFMGVLAVAIVTTLPELTAAITAIRIGAADLAVAGMYGTNAFNIAVLGVADLFFTQGSLFASLDTSHVIAGLFAVLLTGLGMLQLMLRRPLKHFSLMEPSTAVTVAIYVLGVFLVFRMG